MANPVLSSVTGVPTSPVAPGTSVVLTVVVSDADTRNVVVELCVVDSTGAKSAPVRVTLPVVDGVSLSAPDCKIVSGGGTITVAGLTATVVV